MLLTVFLVLAIILLTVLLWPVLLALVSLVLGIVVLAWLLNIVPAWVVVILALATAAIPWITTAQTAHRHDAERRRYNERLAQRDRDRAAGNWDAVWASYQEERAERR
jgi:ABC-type uncharacterized transport system YnjBCD permease subunit